MNEKYKHEVDSIDASVQFKQELKQSIAKKKNSKSFIYAVVLVTCILFALFIFPKTSKQVSPKTPQVLDNTTNVNEVFQVDDPYLHILGKNESWKDYYTSIGLGYAEVEVKEVENLTKDSLGLLDDSITSLPIYLDPYSYDFNEAKQTREPIRLAITNQEIKDLLIQYANQLHMDHYEINYNDIMQEFNLSNDQIELSYRKFDPRAIYVQLKEEYFKSHPQFNLNVKNDEEAYQIIDDFYQYYQELFDFESVQYHITHFYNGNEGGYTYEIYDTSGDSIDNLINASQYYIYLWPDDIGNLVQFSIPINRLKDYYLQDEEIISKEEAIQFFREGKSTKYSDEELLKNIDIAAIELVYRYYDEECEFILPYYIIYVNKNDLLPDSPDLQYVTKGYTKYVRVLIPALSNAYEVSFDSWNNDYVPENEWYFYAKDDKDVQNQYYCNGDATQLRVYQDYYRFKENEPFSEVEMDEQVIRSDMTYILNEITNQYPVINYDQEMKLYEATVGKYTISLDNHLPEYYTFKVAEDEFGLSKAKTLDEAYNALKQFYHRYQGLWGCGDEVKYYIVPIQDNMMNYSILLLGHGGVEGKKIQFWVLEDEVSVTIPTGLEDSLDVLIGSYPIISEKSAIDSFRHGKFLANDLKNYETIPIVDIHLTYLTNHYKCDYRLPYYVITVPCSWEGVVEKEGYQAYKKYYVPALACEY